MSPVRIPPNALPAEQHRFEKDQRALRWHRHHRRLSAQYTPQEVTLLEPVEDDTERFVRGLLSQRGQ